MSKKRLNHREKLRLARRMRVQEANRAAYPDLARAIRKFNIFETDSWEALKRRIAKKVDQVIANQQLAKSKRIFKETGKIV